MSGNFLSPIKESAAIIFLVVWQVGNYLAVLGPCEDCGRSRSRIYIDRVVTMGVGMGGPRAQQQPPFDGPEAEEGVRRNSAGDASASAAAPEERYVNGRYGELRRNPSSSSSASGRF